MGFTEFLERVMEKDKNIRHSVVADLEGKVIHTNHRDGISNFLSEEETSASLRRAALAWKARKALSPKIGKGLYAVAAFEKLTRITFPLGDNHLLFVSMGSDKVRYDHNEGGMRDIIEHVLHMLDGDPTTA